MVVSWWGNLFKNVWKRFPIFWTLTRREESLLRPGAPSFCTNRSTWRRVDLCNIPTCNSSIYMILYQCQEDDRTKRRVPKAPMASDEIEGRKKFWKNSKFLLTISSQYAIIKILQREKHFSKNFKKSFQNSKKVLDKLPSMWYNEYVKRTGTSYR